jgi:hypothetical protein
MGVKRLFLDRSNQEVLNKATHRKGDLTKGRSRNSLPFLLSREFAAIY